MTSLQQIASSPRVLNVGSASGYSIARQSPSAATRPGRPSSQLSVSSCRLVLSVPHGMAGSPRAFPKQDSGGRLASLQPQFSHTDLIPHPLILSQRPGCHSHSAGINSSSGSSIVCAAGGPSHNSMRGGPQPLTSGPSTSPATSAAAGASAGSTSPAFPPKNVLNRLASFLPFKDDESDKDGRSGSADRRGNAGPASRSPQADAPWTPQASPRSGEGKGSQTQFPGRPGSSTTPGDPKGVAGSSTSDSASPVPGRGASTGSESAGSVTGARARRTTHRGGAHLTDSDLDPRRALPIPMTSLDAKPVSAEKVQELLNCDPELEYCKEPMYQWTSKCTRCQGSGYATASKRKGGKKGGSWSSSSGFKCITCCGIGYVYRYTLRGDIPVMEDVNRGDTWN